MSYQIIFYGGVASTILLTFISIFLLVKLKILNVIGDLTGYSARKSMKQSLPAKKKKSNAPASGTVTGYTTPLTYADTTTLEGETALLNSIDDTTFLDDVPPLINQNGEFFFMVEQSEIVTHGQERN